MIKHTAPLAAASVAFGASGYLLNIALARSLGPRDYGSLGLALSLVSLANIVQASGVPVVAARAIAGEEGRAGPIAADGRRAQLVVSVGLMVVLGAAALPLQLVLGHEGLARLLFIICLMLPGFGAMAMTTGYWNGTRRFGRQATVTVTYALAKIVMILPAAALFGIEGALFGYVLSPLVAAALGRIGPSWESARTPSVKPFLTASTPLALTAVTTLAMYSVDLYVVAGRAVDRAAAGHYVAAQSVALIPLTIVSAFGQVATPTVARHLARLDARSADRAIRSGLRQMTLLLAPTCGLLVVAMPALIDVLFGPAFAEATSPARLLVVAYGIVAVFVFLSSCLAGAARMRGAVLGALAGVLVVGAGGSLLIGPLGPPGAAAALGLGASAAALLAWQAVRRTITDAGEASTVG